MGQLSPCLSKILAVRQLEFLEIFMCWSPLFLKHCGIGHLKTRLLPDLKLLQNVPHHSLFKLCKFHEKINGQFFARGQNVLYNAQVLRL